MNHDYIALKFHEARVAELRAEASRHNLVRELLRAKRVLARLGTATTVRALPGRVDAAYGTAGGDDRKAA